MRFDSSVVLANSLIIRDNCYFLQTQFIYRLSNSQTKTVYLFCKINTNYLVEKLKFILFSCVQRETFFVFIALFGLCY